MSYRKLRNDEISALQSNGCTSESWNDIEVTGIFSPANIRNVRFVGSVRIGELDGTVDIEPGITRSCGLYDADIENCIIGNRVYIANTGTIAGYTIGDDVIIENTGSVVVAGTTSFGNGVRLNILNEAGGRELIIYDTLSVQIAYLMVTCRHDKEFISHLIQMIRAYVSGKSSVTGTIGSGVRIKNCITIRNISVGPNASISGASLLEEGTIASTPEDRVIIGYGVQMKNFIVQSGTSIDNGALLTDCFIGQGVRIGKQLSAEHSAFFANCEGFHGEMCSIFAGPYSVSHHKSTLLIAGMFSFYNAGSGTNQSNHMYKLGPVHQGILERGAKTGSFCYLLWPTRVGAFNAIIGAHHSTFDSSDFPFSYVHEENGKSVLTPAMNLFSVGTHRDSVKWPERDRRKDPVRYDRIHFDLFNPYTIGGVLRAQKILQELAAAASKDQEFVIYKGLSIKRLLIKTVVKYYELAVQVYIGNQLFRRLQSVMKIETLQDIKDALVYEGSEYSYEWIDAGGMLMPKFAYDSLILSVRNGEIDSLSGLDTTIGQIYDSFDRMTWAWCAALIEKRTGSSIGKIEKPHILRIIQEWHDSSLKLNNMIANDAAKEFDIGSRIGFGIDGDDSVRDMDFEAVRGSYSEHAFIKRLANEADSIRKHASEMNRTIEQIR
jgi:NDP-sugar pyrophosphorylase family protein